MKDNTDDTKEGEERKKEMECSQVVDNSCHKLYWAIVLKKHGSYS